MARISSLRNLGPKTEEMLREVGIETADDLRQTGAAMAYKILQHRHPSGVNLLFL